MFSRTSFPTLAFTIASLCFVASAGTGGNVSANFIDDAKKQRDWSPANSVTGDVVDDVIDLDETASSRPGKHHSAHVFFFHFVKVLLSCRPIQIRQFHWPAAFAVKSHYFFSGYCCC